MSQIELLTEAVRTLETAGVRYLLSGSFASSLQGEPRATHDIDLVVEVDALGERGMFNLLDMTSGDKVDFWMLTGDPFDASRFERRIQIEAFGLDLWVSSPEDTILQKLRWAAASGGGDRQARDAVGVYEVQRGALNEAYLDAWAMRLGVSDMLSEVRAAATSA